MNRYTTAAGRNVAELGARTADAGRLARGRTLFRKRTVGFVDVAEGSVSTTVRGSNGDDYLVTIAATPAPPGVQREVAEVQDEAGLNRLIDQGVQVGPRDLDVVFDCSCPDWEEPCKHALAALLALAEQVDMDANQLLLWRGIATPSALPMRAAAPPADIAAEPLPAEARRNKVTELEALLQKSFDTPVLRDDRLPAPKIENPALDAFLGVGSVPTPVSLEAVIAIEPLFGQRRVDALDVLGPSLADAIDVIAEQFER